MQSNQAYDAVVDFLKEELGEDNLYTMVRAWNDIETYQRKTGIGIVNYISEMEARWQRAEAARTGKNPGGSQGHDDAG